MFILGFLGVVVSIMYGMITGGGIGPFLHGGAALFVFATSFFAGLAMSKREFNEKVISNTGGSGSYRMDWFYYWNYFNGR